MNIKDGRMSITEQLEIAEEFHKLKQKELTNIQLSLDKSMRKKSIWYIGYTTYFGPVYMKDIKTNTNIEIYYDDTMYYFTNRPFRHSDCVEISLKWTTDGVNFKNPETGYIWKLK